MERRTYYFFPVSSLGTMHACSLSNDTMHACSLSELVPTSLNPDITNFLSFDVYDIDL
jgi:hypothetical protein